MPTVTYESVRQDTRLLNKAGYADTTKDKKEDFPMKKLICMMAALALSVAMICTACAETIQAKPVTIDMDHLENRMVKTDIEYKEGDMMTLTLYVPETFDAEAIKVELEGLGTVGYVANSPYTVLGESYSAGRLYDEISSMML